MNTRLNSPQLIVLTATFIVGAGNRAFFRQLLDSFQGQPSVGLHALSLGLVQLALLVGVVSLFALGRATRPVLAFMLLLSSVTAYFMDTYKVVIDSEMINNAMLSDAAESIDLVTPRLFLYLLLIGILPALLVLRLPLRHETLASAMRSRALLLGAALLTAGLLVMLSSSFYASFFREHKVLRYYSNPLAPLYAAVRYAAGGPAVQGPPAAIGEDARVAPEFPRHELVVMVVGETARADHFALNGYGRETNPRLAREELVSFTQMTSCGTSTAVSLPCMFAIHDRDHFDRDQAAATENALDVLQHAGVQVLWRDNNSSSKGVATRVQTQDYRSVQTNPVCDTECRDIGMLDGLQRYIDHHTQDDILIVLHQMGSHGPAYHKRYPDAFERFTPVCESSQLDACTREAIRNAYDNTILYTDHFLGAVIDLLQANDAAFETALFYVSDHGESLGEGGVYLHGLPYFIAPDPQTHVAAVMWFGDGYDDVDRDRLQALRDAPLSHDDVFHTLLGLFEVRTAAYDPTHDILQQVRLTQVLNPRVRQ